MLLMRCHMDPKTMVEMSLDGASSMKNFAKLIKSENRHHKHYVGTALLIATNLSLKMLRQSYQ